MHIHQLDRWRHHHRFNISDNTNERKTKNVIGITLFMMIIEIVGGMIYGSTSKFKLFKISSFLQRSFEYWLTCLLILLCLCVQGCDSDSEYKLVDFDEKQIVEKPNNIKKTSKILRVAIAAMTSPKETYVYYRELLEYIGKKIDYDIQLVQRKTYGEVNEMFPKRQIDMAFICSGPYAIGKDKYKFVALVTPIIRNEPYYQSYLIVNRKSAFKKIEDLKGHTFAFTDPESNTGALVPQFWLAEMGERADSYFKNYIYTFSHDNSILAVAKKMVDAAAVDGHKWEYYNSRKPFFTSQTKIIKKSDRYGTSPLVASFHLSNQIQKKLQKILLSMHEDTEGAQILNELMIDKFTIPKEEWYDKIRNMAETVKALK